MAGSKPSKADAELLALLRGPSDGSSKVFKMAA
jgi:hypothetical protein